MKIKKNDNVIVLTGKDRGTKAKVLKVFPKKNKVLVEGVNMAKKHVKSRSQSKPGERIDRAIPIDASNVALATKVAKKK
jgi:large subunit ribosomal protein L24